MNITLDLSKSQLSKLRNGHGIRISPSMVGSGVDLIVDPMTYHNMSKKLDKGKGVIIKMGSQEIDANKMEGTGLFAGAGNKSGKISRAKKAGKWLDFTKGALGDAMDLGERGLSIYNKQKDRQSPMGQVKRLFGGEVEMEGGNVFSDAKKFYNKKVKNSAVGKAIRENARKGLSLGFDKGTELLEGNKYTKPIATIGRNSKGAVLDRAMRMSGLGLKLSQGKGMRVAGGMCCQGCGMQYNDKFIFDDQAL